MWTVECDTTDRVVEAWKIPLHKNCWHAYPNRSQTRYYLTDKLHYTILPNYLQIPKNHCTKHTHDKWLEAKVVAKVEAKALNKVMIEKNTLRT